MHTCILTHAYMYINTCTFIIIVYDHVNTWSLPNRASKIDNNLYSKKTQQRHCRLVIIIVGSHYLIVLVSYLIMS